MPVLLRVPHAIASTDVDPNITEAQIADKSEAFADLFALNRGMLEQRFANPGDDYISALARTQVEKDGALDVNALSIHLQGVMFDGDHAVGAFLAYLLTELALRPEIQENCAFSLSRLNTLSTKLYALIHLYPGSSGNAPPIANLLPSP